MLKNDTAVIFVMNRKYIRPLKVLMYSLHVQDSLQACDYIVVTDDRVVAEDPFILSIADDVEYLSAEELKDFNGIRGDRIQEKSKVHFAPKYTFLKFTVFQKRKYRRHVFIDADMLCLNALDEELLSAEFDVKAMKEVSSSKFPIRDEPREKFDRQAAINLVLRADVPQINEPGTGINSGFYVVQNRAISDDVFASAIRISSTEAFGAEQPATSETIRQIPGCTFLELPIWYNARRRVLECLGEAFFEEYREKIKLLHYTPGKPWILGSRIPDYLDQLWLAWEEKSRDWVEAVTSSKSRR